MAWGVTAGETVAEATLGDTSSVCKMVGEKREKGKRVGGERRRRVVWVAKSNLFSYPAFQTFSAPNVPSDQPMDIGRPVLAD